MSSVSAYIKRSNLAKRCFNSVSLDEYQWLKAECQSLTDRELSFFEDKPPQYIVEHLLRKDVEDTHRSIKKTKYKNLNKLSKFSKIKTSYKIAKLFNSTVHKKIIEILAIGEATTTDISIKMKKSHSCISQYIAVLKSVGVLDSNRRGYFIYWELNDNFIKKINILKKLAC